MLTLAFESSAKAASVALVDDGRLIAQYFQDSGLTHSRTLMKMAQDILQNTERSAGELSYISVSNGPGSFTGIRIGIAAAKGLAWGAGLPIRPVSTLLAAVSVFQDEDVTLCPVMDARREEVYNALFKVNGGVITRLCDDRAVSVAQLISEAKDARSPFLLIGDGAKLCYDVFNSECVPVRLAPAMMRLQCAYGVALAAENTPDYAAGDVAANYLRVSQAERLRLQNAE